MMQAAAVLPRGRGAGGRAGQPAGPPALLAAAALAASMAAPFLAGAARAEGFVAWTAVGDAIPEPLTTAAPSAERGRALVADRRVGLCLLCHAAPLPEPHQHGTLAPPLHGVGARYSPAQLRLRVADNRHLNPASLMPAYHRPPAPGTGHVGRAWQGRPVLDAQQVEDVVAYLETLR